MSSKRGPTIPANFPARRSNFALELAQFGDSFNQERMNGDAQVVCAQINLAHLSSIRNVTRNNVIQYIFWFNTAEEREDRMDLFFVLFV